jgi:hypothetical protein
VHSFPVRIVKLRTQKERQTYYCHHHRRQCVKITVMITHEDLCILCSNEYTGSTHDKTALHHCAEGLTHTPNEMIWADTAYSGWPHILTKWDQPRSNQERAFNDVAQIARTRVERYFSFFFQ